MRFMMVVSPAAATGRACSGAPCLITYQSGPIRMEARLREIQRERKGKAEAHAQQNCFTCAHIIMSLSASRSSDFGCRAGIECTAANGCREEAVVLPG